MNTPPILQCSIAALLLAARAFGVTEVWDGGGADNFTFTGANWADNTAPAQDDFATDVIFAGATRTMPIASAFRVRSVTFDNTAAPFRVVGQALQVRQSITNNDTDLQTLDLPVIPPADGLVINAAVGPLAVSSVLKVGVPGGSPSFEFAATTGVSTLFATDITNTLTKTGAATLRYGVGASGPFLPKGDFDLALNAGTFAWAVSGTVPVSSIAAWAVNAGTLSIETDLTADGAQIARSAAGTVTITAGRTLTLQNGADAVFTGAYENGTASTINVNGAGSALSTTAALAINGGSTLNIAQGGVVTAGTALDIGVTTGGTVVVDGVGSRLSAATNDLATLGGSGVTGTLTLRNGATGTLGEVRIGSATAATNTSSLTVLSGATATIRNATVATSAAPMPSGIIVDGAGSILTQTGAATLSLAATELPATGLTVRNGGVFNSGTGLTTVSGTSILSIENGSYAANGDLRLEGGLLTLDASSTFSLAAGRSLAMISGGDAAFSSNLSLTSGQTALVSGAGSTLTLLGAAALRVGNASGAASAVTIREGAALNTANGAATIEPTGTLILDGGTADFNGGLIRNGGLISFLAGRLGFTNDLRVGANGQLGGNLTLLANRELITTGTTLVETSNTLTIDGGTLRTGSLDVDGALDFRRGTLAITGASGAALASGSGFGASLTLNTGANFMVTNALSLAPESTLTIDGGFMAAGSVNNSGSLRLDRGAATVSGGFSNSSGAQLFIDSSFTVAGALTNASGARITLRDGTGRLSGAGALVNDGLLTGDGMIAKPVTNNATGEIRAAAGQTLLFTGVHGPQAGRLTLQGGTVEFAEPFTNASTGLITGGGTLNFEAGLTNEGQMTFSGANTDITGAVKLTKAARLLTTGTAVSTFHGPLTHDGSEIAVSPGARTVFLGPVDGGGPFAGSGQVFFEGGYAPGDSPAIVNLEPSVVFGAANTLVMEVGGLTARPGQPAENGHDKLVFSFTGPTQVTWGGALIVELINGFRPQFGQTFDILDFDPTRDLGEFTTVSLNSNGLLPPDWTVDTTRLYETGEVRVIPEPAGVALCFLGSLVLGLRRCRG